MRLERSALHLILALTFPLAGSSFGAPGFFGFVEPPRTFTVQARLSY